MRGKLFWFLEKRISFPSELGKLLLEKLMLRKIKCGEKRKINETRDVGVIKKERKDFRVEVEMRSMVTYLRSINMASCHWTQQRFA